MARICVFGDSLAWGSWDPDNGGWVARLRNEGCRRVDLLGDYHAVYNCSIAGERLAGVAARFDAEVSARQPAVVVLAIGINDIARSNYVGTPVQDFHSDYSQLLERAQAIAIDVVVVTPTNVDESRVEHDYLNARIEPLVDIVKQCATAQNVVCADVFGAMTPQDLEPDGVHPGANGHEKLYGLIAPTVFDVRSLRQR